MCHPRSGGRDKRTRVLPRQSSQKQTNSCFRTKKKKKHFDGTIEEVTCVGLCPPLVGTLHICPKELSLQLSRERYKRTIPKALGPALSTTEGRGKKKNDGQRRSQHGSGL